MSIKRNRIAAMGIAGSIVGLGSASVAEAGVNLLSNPGFETGTYASWNNYVTGTAGGGNTVNNWYIGGGSDAHTGSDGGDIAVDTTSGPGFNGLYQTVAATAGNSYSVAGWVRSVSLAPDSYAYLQVQFQNAAGTSLAQYTTAHITTNQPYTFERVTNGPSLSLLAPANTAKAQIQAVVFQTTAATGGHTEFWTFDDFNLSAVNPIISLTSSGAPPTSYGSQITNGAGNNQGTFSTNTNKLTVVGSNSLYHVAQATGIKSSTGTAGNPTAYIEANGFNPATDQEIYALDVIQSTGAQATTTQLNTLVSDINSSTAYGSNATIATTSLTGSDPFASNYNLFLTFSSPPSADNYLAFDLTNDPNYATTLAGLKISAIAVVPEPKQLGLFALASVGVLTSRRRRR
jgi:hypothetical protein